MKHKPHHLDPATLRHDRILDYLDGGRKSWVAMIPNFLPPEQANQAFTSLLGEVPWQYPMLKFWGKSYQQPRGTALYGDPNLTYAYSDACFKTLPWLPTLDIIRNKISEAIGEGHGWSPNVCLANLYRDGNDCVALHSDNEPELGPSPQIVSFSLGETRTFVLKQKGKSTTTYSIPLHHNSLLIMGGFTQDLWRHGIPRRKSSKPRNPLKPRVNLTFRHILSL